MNDYQVEANERYLEIYGANGGLVGEITLELSPRSAVLHDASEFFSALFYATFGSNDMVEEIDSSRSFWVATDLGADFAHEGILEDLNWGDQEITSEDIKTLDSICASYDLTETFLDEDEKLADALERLWLLDDSRAERVEDEGAYQSGVRGYAIGRIRGKLDSEQQEIRTFICDVAEILTTEEFWAERGFYVEDREQAGGYGKKARQEVSK